MKLASIKEALHVSDKYQVEPIDSDSVHASSIVNLKRKDQENPRNFFLKGYVELEGAKENMPDEYGNDNLIDDEMYPYGKLAGFIEYAAYKVYKYLGLKVPKAFHIHFNHIADRHELLVSAFKNPKTFGDYIGDKKKDEIWDNKIRKENFMYALFIGNSDFHGGNVAVKFGKNNAVKDYYMFDLELCFRSIPDNLPMFQYYLTIADKMDKKSRNKQMRVIKNIDLKEINYIIDVAREHAYLVIDKSIPRANRFRRQKLKKWDELLQEVGRKMKANIKKNKKYLLEHYPV
jgi:hypothetical protein